MQHHETIVHQIILLGLHRNHQLHKLTITDIARSCQDPIKLGINKTVVIIYDHKELNRYPLLSHNNTNIQHVGIHDTIVILSRSHKY